ncbi:lantibiotic dehydratase [Lentzea sp. NPDC102401]|uniref:lantibiotic dehydratase n=1 Tax=Lentzea sp. NPDC102401 TaxID=3364128 RepID=UPI00380A3676
MTGSYRVLGAALIRATTIPSDIDLPAWPDFTDDDIAGWTDWLRQLWEINDFVAAVEHASPVLSSEVRKLISSPVRADASPRGPRRTAEAVARYLLRWQSRATPYGLFAGVAPINIGGTAATRWGSDHRVVLRPDATTLYEQLHALEAQLPLLRTANVVTNSLGFARGSRWVVPGAGSDVSGTTDRLCDVEVELSGPVRLAIMAARSPIPFTDLTDRIAVQAPEVDTVVIETMLAELVAHDVLISAVRPPMTATDPVAHVARFTTSTTSLEPAAADLRLDCSITLPDAVLREAELAASTLTRIAPHVSGWRKYHQDFLERYGTDAAVPLRELLGGSGLGYPAGYRGSQRRDVQSIDSRTTILATLAQRAALRGQHEIVLDDDLIERLAGESREPVPHTELRFSLAASSLRDLNRGEFTLSVLSGARHAGVTVGRFLHLLSQAERERFRHVYTCLPTQFPDAVPVQISVPPLVPKMTAVARVPAILPILPLGEYHEAADVDVDDLAVAADARRMWLTSLSRNHPVEPLLLNAVDLPTGQQPLARFITEVCTALAAPCRPFSWGPVGRDFPFLPRIRYGRSILHSARWLVEAADLPPGKESRDRWRERWEQLRGTYRIPAQVFLGARDTRIRLNLDEPAHLSLLRTHLNRNPTATLTETAGHADWLQGRAHEIVLTLGRRTNSQRPRARSRRASTATHRPGLSPWLYTKLYGLVGDILREIPQLGDVYNRGSWFLRYNAPVPHLRLRLALRDEGEYARTAQRLRDWTDQLRGRGLLADYTIDTYRPETRFGTGPTLAAAEAVFAADSRAIISRSQSDPVVQTAAGMINIARGFADDGLNWLLDHVDHRGKGSTDRQVQHHRDAVIDTASSHQDLTLQLALAHYRTRVDDDGMNADSALGDLLHLHHARTIGPDLASELYCLRVARAAAKTMLIRSTS